MPSPRRLLLALHTGSGAPRREPGRPPPWRRLLPVALVGFGFALILVSGRVGLPAEPDPLAPFVVGNHTGIDVELRERGLALPPADQLSRFGYDGQWFLGQALDPLVRGDLPATFDAPRYRSLRVLLPAAGWLLAGGQPAAVPYALLLVGALSVGLGCAATGRIVAAFGRSRWWGVTFALVPGVVVGVSYGTAEPPGLALAALGVSLLLDRRHLAAGLALSGAALTKENYLAFAVGAACYLAAHGYLRGRSWLRPVTAVVAPGVVGLLAWWAYVTVTLPPDDNPHGPLSRFSPPLVGWAELLATVARGVGSAGGPVGGWSGSAVLVATLGLLLAAVGSTLRRRQTLPAYLALGWGLYGLVIAGFLLERYLSAQRALAPAVLAAGLFLLTARRELTSGREATDGREATGRRGAGRPADPAAPGGAGLPRRVLRRALRELAAARRTTVRTTGAGGLRVTRLPGRGWRRLLPADPDARVDPGGGRLALRLPEPSGLVELATSGVLTGEVRRLELRLSTAPEWLTSRVRPPRPDRTCRELRWRRRRSGLVVRMRWSRPYETPRALGDLLAAVLRARPWEQAGGPVYALDRPAWRHGGGCWPQGRLARAAPPPEPDAHGHPLGPYLAVAEPAGALPPPVVTAVANPSGRRLVGAATGYRLLPGGRLADRHGRTLVRVDRPDRLSAALLRGALDKYAVIIVDTAVAEPLLRHGLRILAACGAVFAAADPVVRAALTDLGLVAVADPGEVADLPGYTASVTAARRMAIAGDAALRRTALAGDGAVPLPAVSVLLSSKREEELTGCLRQLAGQDYPALEVLIGLHGYDVPEATRRHWQELLPMPLRVLTFAAELPFGAVLGRLSRAADGDLLTKVDDDDHYGRHHVTDLVLAWHTTGADLAAKGARFVHLAERGETIDRAWAAPEGYDVTPAGGTILLGRGTLQQVGGWSHAPRHVDADLLTRVRDAGGLVYRTHGLEYVYVRRTTGHTFVTSLAELRSHGESVYPGLPAGLLSAADPAGVAPGSPALRAQPGAATR